MGLYGWHSYNVSLVKELTILFELVTHFGTKIFRLEHSRVGPASWD